MAYCLINHKEFFAEMSVTFLSDSYHSLDKETGAMEQCSPPLLSPVVVSRVCHEQSRKDKLSQVLVGCERMSCNENLQQFEMARLINDQGSGINNSKTHCLRKLGFSMLRFKSRDSHCLPHCNKFYPFTRGQFAHFDPEMIEFFISIWEDIQEWKNNEDERFCLKNCFCIN
mmetsp:Transcript_64616/g.75817  ORF Transcript_64616/g.75817 Transcript_64616/m.75817 type:complete len:171 (+) Transcript_64616:878-1390(+)